MKPPAESNPGGWSFRGGIALIVASFAIYPLYPLIALLASPVGIRVTEALAGSAVSWLLFLIGTALAGKDAVGYVRRRLLIGRAAPRLK